MLTFTVPPFSGKNYYDNSTKVSTPATPCAICGKATVNASVWARVCQGGAIWCGEDGEVCSHEPSGVMDMFPIGSDCARKYKAPKGYLAHAS